MSYGQWAPNWRTWRNSETSNARNWQTEATSTSWNWPTRMAPPPPPPPPPVRNWQIEATSTARNRQTRMAPPPPPPVRNWQTGMPPPPPPPPPRGLNRQNAMARRDGWRTGDIDRFAERNWHIGPNNNYSRNWQTRQNRREWNWQTLSNRGEWNWQTLPNRRRRAWNWETESLPWTRRVTQQEDYIPYFPFDLALPPPFDPWRPSEDRIPLLLTGLQEVMEIQERFLMQLPALEELPRSTEAEHRAALQQLKKTTYNPRPMRDGDSAGEDDHGKEKEKDQETGDSDNVGEDAHGKEKETQTETQTETETCTVCLEDFKAEEEVMLTPCNHMFHEDCIVPWAKSHAQCPICRLQFATLPMNSNQP